MGSVYKINAPILSNSQWPGVGLYVRQGETTLPAKCINDRQAGGHL